MARSFSNNSTDRIQTTLTANSDLRSYAMWFYRTTGATGNSIFSRMFAKQAGSARTEFLYWEDNDGVAPNNIINYNRLFSTTEGQWSCSNVGYYDAWHHICVTYDSSSTSNDPLIYLDGVSQTVTEDTAPSGTRTDTADALNLGNRADGNRSWYGSLAEFGCWDAILTADEVASLAKGFRPPKIRPQSLIHYEPMVRENVNPKGTAATITGTSISSHPRVIY